MTVHCTAYIQWRTAFLCKPCLTWGLWISKHENLVGYLYRTLIDPPFLHEPTSPVICLIMIQQSFPNMSMLTWQAVERQEIYNWWLEVEQLAPLVFSSSPLALSPRSLSLYPNGASLLSWEKCLPNFVGCWHCTAGQLVVPKWVVAMQISHCWDIIEILQCVEKMCPSLYV